MLDYARLLNDARSYDYRLEMRSGVRKVEKFEEVLTVPADLVKWIDYFCKFYFDSGMRLQVLYTCYEKYSNLNAKASICKELGLSYCSMNNYLIDIYQLILFCDRTLSGVKYMSLPCRVDNKLYDLIFVKELIHSSIDDKRAETGYVNALARAGVQTVKDLLESGADNLIKESRISYNLLLMLSDRLKELGCFDFKVHIPESNSNYVSYRKKILGSKSKEEAIEVLLECLENRGNGAIVSAFRETWG